MKKYVLVVTAVSALMVSAVFGQNAGVVWTEVKDSPFKGGHITSIAWGKDKFVAVGHKEVGDVRTNTISYSSDGITWTVVKNRPFDRGYFSRIYWHNDRFIAYGWDGGSQNEISAYSSDGITWTSVNSHHRFNNVAYGNNMFVAVSDIGGIAYSSDGITWTLVSEFEGQVGCGSGGGESNIVWGNGTFIAALWSDACEGYEVRSAHSSDGINWTWTEIDRDFSYVVWGNDKFVASGSHSGIMYSSNGIVWKEVKNKIFDEYQVGNITWGNNRFIVHVYSLKCDSECECCYPVGKNFAYSSDGITWTLAKNYPFGKSKTDTIVYGNGVFVAGSEDGKIAYSK